MFRYVISRNAFIMRNGSYKSCRENQNTHFMFLPPPLPRKSCRGSVEKYCRPGKATDDIIIWRMRVACSITKATNTLRICNTSFPLQELLLHTNAPQCYIICTLPVYLYQYLTNLMHKICFTISFISCLYMFRAHVLIIRRSKVHYTASGIITPIAGRLM